MSRPPQRPAPAAPRKPNSKSNAATQPQAKGQLHPRNRHQGRYDFPALIKACPALADWSRTMPNCMPE